MFLYFSEKQARTRDNRDPDFFFVDQVHGLRPRHWWAIWEEGGRFPDFIMEHLSPNAAHADLTVKKHLYERTFRTPEYLCNDPESEKLQGWRLGDKGRYQAIKPNKRGWLWSEVLRVWVGTGAECMLSRRGPGPVGTTSKAD